MSARTWCGCLPTPRLARLTEPDQGAGQMQKGQEVPSGLLVAGGKSSRALEPMEETLDAVSNRVQAPVIAVDHGSRRVGRNHDFHAPRCSCAANGFGVVPGVADEGRALRMSKKVRGDGNLMLLARRQLDVKGTSSPVDQGMDLRRESTA